MQLPIGSRRPDLVVLSCLLSAALALASATASPSEPVDEGIAEELAAGAKKHRKPQKLPIELGTSGGNSMDFNVSGIPCISNTLGGLVQGDAQYILSSNGTLARRNDADKGEAIIQPGLRDTKRGACNPKNPKGHAIADLTKFKKLKFGGRKNLVDAAVAEVRPGTVDSQGSILGIGVPGSHVVAPFLGQQVQKSGRGTGVIKGTVNAMNVSVNVNYLGRTVRFIKQFTVRSNSNKEIYTSGDSGALFFEDRETCPGWVGLAVAGSTPTGTVAWFSPMSTVLKQLQKVKPRGSLEPVGCKSESVGVQEGLSAEIAREVRDAEQIQRRLERDVLRVPGVVGMGIGLAEDDPSQVVFKILVEDDARAVREHLPARLGKMRYELLRVGPVEAM